MSKVSLLLLTKNEQENLKEWGNWIHKINCLNEIVVIDDGSDDDTLKILKSFSSSTLSINIFKRKLDNNFSNQRNFGISKCKNDWILFLDADEIPTLDTINYLNKLSPLKGHNYSFKRNIIYLGHQLSHGQCLHDRPIKFFNKNEGKFIGPVHEVWQSTSTTINSHQIINHHSIKNLNSFLIKINLYSDIRAKELFDQKKKTNLWEIIFYPKFKFIDLHILKLGFLDGIPGLILSLSLSFNSFLVRSKLWHLSQK
jgi:glycosyltransferase involved in cell wall biosynthesis